MAKKRDPDAPRRSTSAGRPARTRRRGDVLEQAIFDATLTELAEAGYGNVTMEGVAKRAHTSKTVLYRRWPNAAELILAALRHHLRPLFPGEPPDTGSLRGDVLALLHLIAERLQELDPPTVHGLLSTHSGDLGLSFLHARSDHLDTMATLFERAVLRGELAPRSIPPRIATLPIDLVRHDILFVHAAPDEEMLEEIVDTIFLPLARSRDSDSRADP
jgi:AcrR family transcriptional regulator